MANLYGFFGNTVYRMSTRNQIPKLISNFDSSTIVKVNESNNTVTAAIKLNSMDFTLDEANEILYDKMLDFLRRQSVKYIDTLHYCFKIALDYTVSDAVGNILDSGIRYVNADAEDCYILLPMDEATNIMPYRRAQCVKRRIELSKCGGAQYGVLDQQVTTCTFKINSIKLYANTTDEGSPTFIRKLGVSAENMTFPYASSTVSTMTNTSILLFDTLLYDISFDPVVIPNRPTYILVDIYMLLNNFCNVGNDTAIWEIVSENGGIASSAKYIFDEGFPPRGPFDPIVERRPCPGDLYYPYGRMVPPPPPPKPGKFPPGVPPYCDPKNTNIIKKPLISGDNWDDQQSVSPVPTYNQAHGEFHTEWCMANSYDDESVKFKVVSDNISDSEFDALTMVKYSEVVTYISDVQIGDYVKQFDVLYY